MSDSDFPSAVQLARDALAAEEQVGRAGHLHEADGRNVLDPS